MYRSRVEFRLDRRSIQSVPTGRVPRPIYTWLAPQRRSEVHNENHDPPRHRFGLLPVRGTTDQGAPSAMPVTWSGSLMAVEDPQEHIPPLALATTRLPAPSSLVLR